MKLGEMLVRDGRIESADLERVIVRQMQEGGRIGSLMVAEGLIDAETLTVYLGLELGIPIATGATFERCKRSAVRLLTPEMASRFRCIPIVIQSQTLIVAVDDPRWDAVGRGTLDQGPARRMMFADPTGFDTLIERITEAISALTARRRIGVRLATASIVASDRLLGTTPS